MQLLLLKGLRSRRFELKKRRKCLGCAEGSEIWEVEACTVLEEERKEGTR